ncbi:MAG: sporulation peptidase YabG [Cellulosilyticum sp.]|nr:sporulation peptidase YabG [Cellulosilyticum sp.]
MFSPGDYVVRLSYNKDILFRITYILPNQAARLIGVSYRIIADAPLSDLIAVDSMRYTSQEDSVMNTIDETVQKIIKKRQEMQKGKTPTFQKTGTVLHMDGDAFYLQLCLKYYKALNIPAIGEHVPESEQPKKVKYFIEKYSPDILVLTGHDSLNKNYKDLYDLTEYRNSSYFVESVKRARSVKSSEAMVIFAGACQSYFEEILAAGADYAASPSRVLIHALDPVFVVEKIAHCPFHQVVSIDEALENSITKFKGLGGYEVLGKCRRGGPVMLDDNAKKTEVKEERGEKKSPNQMTSEEIQRELAMPLFKDTNYEFRNRMQEYFNKNKSLPKNER